MTSRILRFNLAIVSLYFVTVLATAAFGGNNLRVFIKDFIALFIALPAAYVGYCFQQRQAFLKNLADLWKLCIEAKGGLLTFTHLETPSADDFGKAHHSLSVAIDMMRSVYRNVGETSSVIGWYPYEPLHDMRRALDKLGWQGSSPEQRKAARDEVVSAWNSFRFRFLAEFPAAEPVHPIVERSTSDPRRTSARRG
jgi:hypothetical protein